MTRDAAVGGPLIAGFAGNGFRIDGVGTIGSRFDALLLTTTEAQPWTPPPLAALAVEALGALVEATPEFVLLGTGATLIRPPAPLVAALEAKGIGVEPMDSRAAARAWGVLRGEGRRVAAALYPLDYRRGADEPIGG